MFGSPEDVPGECNAHLDLADDYGDNSCTIRCQLPRGHEGPHEERCRAKDEPIKAAHNVVIEWCGDDRWGDPRWYKRFMCPTHGEMDEALIDGYVFGDRILEGVMFRVTIVGEIDNRRFKVAVEPRDSKYFEVFNKAVWINKAVTYLKKAEFVSCPHRGCKEYVDVPIL